MAFAPGQTDPRSFPDRNRPLPRRTTGATTDGAPQEDRPPTLASAQRAEIVKREGTRYPEFPPGALQLGGSTDDARDRRWCVDWRVCVPCG